MAKAPLTFATAKLGDTYQSADGKTFKKVASPYDPSGKAMISVLMDGTGAATTAGPVGTAPKRALPIPASMDPTVTEAAQADPVAATPDPTPPAPVAATPAPEPVAATVEQPADVDLSVAHKADLQARQALADQNSQASDELHAQMDATPPPSRAPEPVPTVTPQPFRPIQASVLPPAVASDIGTGLLNAPTEVTTGIKHAVRNLIGFSDHISDLVEEHVPGTIYYKGFDHIGEPGNQLSVSLDTAANFAKHDVADPRPGATMDRALPDSAIDHPTSVTGNLIQGAAQFTTGFAAGGAILKGWRAAAGAGQVIKGMAQGALSDFGAFDAHQQRLSDLLKAHAPDAIKPVLDYLASDPRDGETEGRFKNALEGLGLGAAMHGIISAARHLKAARMIQRAAALAAKGEGLQGVIDAPHARVVATAEKFLHDLADDVGSIAGKGYTIARKFPLTPEEVAATADAGTQGPNTIGLNYAKIADADDMQAAAVQFYDAFHPEITDAKRGVQSINKQIQDAFGADMSRILGDWEPGKALVSHELTALRFAQAAALRDFMGHARAIAAGDASLAKQAAFLQTGFVMDAITRAVEGGKAEAARTLRTLQETIPSMAGDLTTPAGAIEFYRKADAMIAGSGGREAVERAAKAFLLVNEVNPQGVSKFLRAIGAYDQWQKGAKEVIRVYMTNGILAVKGVTTNIISNTNALLWERIAREVAPLMYDAAGVESHVAPGEGSASAAGAVSAFQDMMRLSRHINADGSTGRGLNLAANFDRAKAKTKGFTPSHREEVQVAEGTGGAGAGLERGPQNDTPLGRASNFVYNAVRLPGRTHGALDDFSNIISGRAELAAQAYRQATRDAATGAIQDHEIGAQALKYMEDPSASMLESVVAAQQQTSWTRTDGQFAKGIKTMREWGDSIPVPFPIGTAIFPIVNTPANVFSYGVRSSPLAPLSSRFWEDIRSPDGATRQLAMTKMAMGSMLSLWVANHVGNGDITGGGPADPAQKQAMMRTDPKTGKALWAPYSIRIGDNWISYEKVTEPLGSGLRVAADMAEMFSRNDWTDSRVQNATEMWGAGIMHVGNAFMSQSTMQGAQELMDAMADNTRGGVSKAASFLEKRVTMLLPFSGALSGFRQQTDPYRREVTNMVDAFRNTIPGMSATLPMSFDLWGRPRTYRSNMGSIYDFVVPAKVVQVGGEAADREMLRLGFAKQMPAKEIGLGNGLKANLRNYPTIYNEILTRGGPPALEEINGLVSGADPNSDYYNSLADGSDPHAPGSKARYLDGRLRFHFAEAVASIKRDFADDLQEIASEQAGRRAAAREAQ